MFWATILVLKWQCTHVFQERNLSPSHNTVNSAKCPVCEYASMNGVCLHEFFSVSIHDFLKA